MSGQQCAVEAVGSRRTNPRDTPGKTPVVKLSSLLHQKTVGPPDRCASARRDRCIKEAH